VPNTREPEISTLSLISIVPPAESNTRLPAVVVILLLAPIPKSKSPAYTPPNCASCHGEEASSPPLKSSSFVNTNLSV
jgi:hypothetical protein